MSFAEEILENLNTEQKEAVTHTEGPLLILAGAGSGKTRVIVHRIAYLLHEKKIPAYKIAAVTFTNKAAQEMLERTLSIAGPMASDCLIRTYHSLGLYFLRQNAHYINYPSGFTIWDDTDQKGAIEKLVSANFTEKFNKTQIKYFSQTISSFKDMLISPEELSGEIDLDAYEFGEILPDIYRLYEIQKQNSLAVDFADLIFMVVKIFQKFPEALETVQNKYQYFLVDEYQDTNHAQYTLIQLLSSKNKNLCVVGDDDQAIYGWRGADVTNILEFQSDFKDAKIVKLEQNYRSTQPILDLANHVISKNEDRMPKKLWTAKKEGVNPHLKLLKGDNEEAYSTAAMVSSFVKNISPDEIAVLYRTNSQSRLFEEAFLEMKIPYRIFGAVSFFARKEVKDVLSYFRFLINPFDEASFLRLINNPSRGIGEKSIQKLYEAREKLQSKLGSTADFLMVLNEISSLGLSKKAEIEVKNLYNWTNDLNKKIKNHIDFGFLLEDILEKSGLGKMYEEEDRLLGSSRKENLRELKESLLRFQLENKNSTLADYLQNISLYTSAEESGDLDNKPRVNLMTVHNAKGLEFDTVILTGMDEDVFPHYLAKKDGSCSEERRLFYVAVTRAKNRLYLTRAQTRFKMGYRQVSEPSQFLLEIPGCFMQTEEEISSTSFYEKKSYNTAPKFPNMINLKDFSKDKTETSSSFNSLYKPGDKIRHPNFGRGRILRLEGTGEASKIHIFFEDNKSRKFLLKYTKLEKI
ncbi:MAG: UvrD-helicase domain-containing protein [Spirochaetia bacterium]|nr:UvrD-helicase domain-containing protein [Spirochaetia bacterium]